MNADKSIGKHRSRLLWLFLSSAMLLLAADPSWKAKRSSDWTPEDSREILTNSPWSKPVWARVAPLQTEDERREGGNMGQPHGIGYDGLADGRPRVHLPTSLLDLVRPEKQTLTAGQYIPVQLRWESALPIRLAELKTNSTEAPAVETGGYVVAVYGIPPSNAKGTPKSLGEPLKKLAVLKRPGKSDVRPVEVEVLQQEDGTIVLYRFPSSAEITKGDRFDFQAQIGRVFISQSFDAADMYFGGNLEL
jgi:hypothetical protein